MTDKLVVSSGLTSDDDMDSEMHRMGLRLCEGGCGWIGGEAFCVPCLQIDMGLERRRLAEQSSADVEMGRLLFMPDSLPSASRWSPVQEVVVMLGLLSGCGVGLLALGLLCEAALHAVVAFGLWCSR